MAVKIKTASLRGAVLLLIGELEIHGQPKELRDACFQTALDGITGDVVRPSKPSPRQQGLGVDQMKIRQRLVIGAIHRTPGMLPLRACPNSQSSKAGESPKDPLHGLWTVKGARFRIVSQGVAVRRRIRQSPHLVEHADGSSFPAWHPLPN